jgi:hypothetical protein
VDWDNVEMLFWPRCAEHDDSTEPDLVMVSNRWVIVVEAKLGSGFGDKQPWREYLVGQHIAESRGLSRDAVYYVIVSRAILHGAQVFSGLGPQQRDRLEPKTLWFRWLDAVTLVDGWLRQHVTREWQTAKNEARMLGDLLEALRRRRTLSFCGFSFTYHQPVREAHPPIFCPPLFNGFLYKNSVKCDSPVSIGFLVRFQGFLRNACHPVVPMESMRLRRFQGFARSAKPAPAPSGRIFFSQVFKGFVFDTPWCAVSSTMAGLKKRFFRDTFPPVVPMESMRLRRFHGFARSAKPAHTPSEYILCSCRFKGFVNNAPPCVASTTMVGFTQ